MVTNPQGIKAEYANRQTMRRTQIHRHGDDQNVEPIPTQQFVRTVVENGDDKDADFAVDPWLYVAKQGADYMTPLGSIRKGVNTHRVAQIYVRGGDFRRISS